MTPFFQRGVPALLILLVLCGAGFALHQWGQHIRNAMQQKLADTQQRRLTLQTQQRQIQADIPRIQQDLQRYERAQAMQWLRAEDRLTFSESLARHAQTLRLVRLEYGVSPRNPVANSPLLYSPIELQVVAHHEEQLVRFIEGFHYLRGGIPALQRCEVTINQGNEHDGALTARCRGNLFSLNHPVAAR